MANIPIYDTFSQVRSTDPNAQTENATVIEVRGPTTANDGGGGTFYYIGNGYSVGSGVDDDGWHIRTSFFGELWARMADVNIPQQWGVFPKATESAAHTANDDWTSGTNRMQKWLNFWSDPTDFAGWNQRPRGNRSSFRTEAPHGFYRCRASLNVTYKSISSPYSDWANAQSPGDLIFYGHVMTPEGDDITAFVVTGSTSPTKSRCVLRGRKQRKTDPTVGLCKWTEKPYPDLIDDSSQYRPWSTSLRVYHKERVWLLRGDGSTHLYEVQTTSAVLGSSGLTSAAQPPVHTDGSTQTDGEVLQKSLGSIKNNSGKSVVELLFAENNCCVKITNLLNHEGLEVTPDGYCVGVMVRPTPGSGAGWSKLRIPQAFSTKVALCLMPNASGASASWTNDNLIEMGLVDMNVHSSLNETGTTKGVYGAVFAPWDVAGATASAYIGCTHNHVKGLSLENSRSNDSPGATTEWVEVVFWGGDENTVEFRTDNPSKFKAAKFIARNDGTHSHVAHANRVIASRKQMWQNNGCGNYLDVRPVPPDPSAELYIPNLKAVAGFSGDNTLYLKGMMGWVTTAAAPVAGLVQDTSLSWRYHPDDHSFDFKYTRGPTVLLDLSKNEEEDAQLLITRYYATTGTATDGNWDNRNLFCVLDKDDAKILNNTWSMQPVRVADPELSTANLTALTSPHNHWFRDPVQFIDQRLYGVARFVRKLAIKIQATRLIGLRIQVFRANRARFYTQFEQRQTLEGGPWIDSKPKKGYWERPSILWYRNPATARGSYLNVAGPVYSVSGLKSNGGTIPGEWRHDGAGNVYEWDTALTPAAWVPVASGATVSETTDWVDF